MAQPAPIPVALFLPPAGTTEAEHWMARARSAAALDLVERLSAAGFGPVFALAPEADDRERLSAAGATLVELAEGPFEFGPTLARVFSGIGGGPAAYFGGASAPLADDADLLRWRERAMRLSAGGALVNNLHSTDWAILTDAAVASSLADRFPSDNAIGWTLAHQGQVRVESLEPSAASRADLDTPSDLALARRHAGLGRHLKARAQALPESLLERVRRLEQVLRTPAASLALIGRVSETAWARTVAATRLWVRVYAEERGMRASGRQAQGLVRSLIGDLVDEDGPDGFLERLATMADACVWDTRVWMARRGWPSTADRMASDFGWADQVGDPGLSRLTRAISEAALPVVSGGHGVVSGSLLAMVESLSAGADGEGRGEPYQPSR